MNLFPIIIEHIIAPTLPPPSPIWLIRVVVDMLHGSCCTRPDTRDARALRTNRLVSSGLQSSAAKLLLLTPLKQLPGLALKTLSTKLLGYRAPSDLHIMRALLFGLLHAVLTCPALCSPLASPFACLHACRSLRPIPTTTAADLALPNLASPPKALACSPLLMNCPHPAPD